MTRHKPKVSCVMFFVLFLSSKFTFFYLFTDLINLCVYFFPRYHVQNHLVLSLFSYCIFPLICTDPTSKSKCSSNIHVFPSSIKSQSSILPASIPHIHHHHQFLCVPFVELMQQHRRQPTWRYPESISQFPPTPDSRVLHQSS